MTDKDTRGTQLGSREYLQAAFETSDRLAILVRNRERKETVQRITTAGRIAEPSFQEWLHFKNDREGFDIYVGMNPLKPDARTRTKEDILSIRHLYVDLDHDGAKSLASIEQSSLVPQPNYVLATSPDKFQVIWRIEEVAQEQAEALLRAMARKFGGDSAATDSTRVLRIPGFANKKYEAGYVVGAEQHSDRVHHSLDFKLRMDHDDAPYQALRRNSTRAVSTEPRPLSQSEHDWAFAKRALAHGTDPEEVIRKIAQFREGDKHDVLDYARRTVRKAQAELRQVTSGQDQESRTPESI
jgi:RepB DNA-primase N-terminal domain/RepB DNA-primase C-terminal helical domain